MQHIIDGARQKYDKLKENEKSFSSIPGWVFLGTVKIRMFEAHARMMFALSSLTRVFVQYPSYLALAEDSLLKAACLAGEPLASFQS